MFLLKLTTRKKLNFIPVAILILSTLFLVTMNTRASTNAGFKNDITSYNKLLEELIDKYESYDKISTDKIYLEQIAIEKKRLATIITLNKKSIELAEKNDWKAALTLQLKVIDEMDIKKIEDKDQYVPVGYPKFVFGKKATYQYLIKNNLKPNILTIENQGFPYLFRAIDVLFPVLVVLCIITLLTNLFTENFKQGMNLDNLFPLKKQRLLASKLTFGVLVASIVYAITLLISFASATLISGSNSPSYPAVLNTPSYTDIRPIGALMLEGLFLQFLCIIFLVLFVYIIAQLTKNKVATLFISIFILCGLTLTLAKIQPLASILHGIPITYFNTIAVLLRDISFETGNANVTLISGTITLTVSILIELAIVTLLNYKRSNYKENKLAY